MTATRHSKRNEEQNLEDDIEINEIGIEDLHPVFLLGERSFTAGRWPNLYRTWDEYEVVNFFASDRETCFVAKQGERLLGFVLGTTIAKRRSAWSYGWIVWLAVDPGVKKRGVGRALFKEVQSKFIELGNRMLLVDTDARNHEAIDFFKRQGFGHENKHVYMSLNLTHLPEYKRLRQADD
ncbi:MAG: GNAT family N-acetyltransferase [Myxococcota bacterium]|jgi:ribosomal protein S18 acetylase RimI-like enzyme|nr:GNAT family N-acetyltransferase [Myxococcota bacterium]